MKPALLAASFFMAASSFALDTTDIDKKIKELNGTDVKARAAAIKELAPLFADLLISLQKARTDTNPDVIAAMKELEKHIEAKAQKVPELAGCASDGATYQEALFNVQVVIREWIETATELGRPIPAPRGRLIYA